MTVNRDNLFKTMPVSSNQYLTFIEDDQNENIIVVVFGGKIAGWIIKEKELSGNCSVEEVPGAFIAYDVDKCIPALLPTMRSFAMILGKKWNGSQIEILAL